MDCIPAQEMLLSGAGQSARYVSATRDAEGSFALVYIPQAGQTVQVDLSMLNTGLDAYWFDPRTGETQSIGEIQDQDSARFTTPASGPDWVLMLDTAG